MDYFMPSIIKLHKTTIWNWEEETDILNISASTEEVKFKTENYEERSRLKWFTGKFYQIFKKEIILIPYKLRR